MPQEDKGWSFRLTTGNPGAPAPKRIRNPVTWEELHTNPARRLPPAPVRYGRHESVSWAELREAQHRVTRLLRQSKGGITR